MHARRGDVDSGRVAASVSAVLEHVVCFQFRSVAVGTLGPDRSDIHDRGVEPDFIRVDRPHPGQANKRGSAQRVEYRV